jgi:tetratricopeptide (TPR) repeat protein
VPKELEPTEVPTWRNRYPTKRFLILNRARSAWIRIKKYPEAITAFSKTIQLDPNQAGYHAWLSRALNGNKQYKAALKEANVALQLDPQLGMGFSPKQDLKLKRKNCRVDCKRWSFHEKTDQRKF